MLLSILTLSTLADQQRLVLADNGKSDYSIVLPTDPTPAERRAAEELQRYVKEISGAELPIAPPGQTPSKAILLGNAQTNPAIAQSPLRPEAALGMEGYALFTHGQSLIVYGGRPRGVLYGVYGLLEDHLGCRWYTSEVGKIPKRDRIEIGELNETVIPSFEYREPFWTEAWDADWAARNRCNGNFMRLGEREGGKIGFQPFVHSFYEILPPAQYFEEHPEYYSEIDGKRKHEGAQLCLTNTDVMKLTVDKVRQWIAEKPEARIFSVSQNDWYGQCQCEQCRQVYEEEGAPSGLVLRFVNEVAAAIAQDHPDKLIETLAYQWTEKTPKLARPHPNVRVRMAPIGNCFGHPIDQCPVNKEPFANLQAWAKITDNLYIWHYNTNFAHYFIPFPDFDELQGSNRAYKANGVKGLFYQGAYGPGGGGESSELKAWFQAKILWNAKLDVWPLVEEFVNAVYEEAAPPILAYYKSMHETVKQNNIHFKIFDDPKTLGYLNEDSLAKAERLFDQAEEAVKEKPTVLSRVQKLRLSIDYAQLRLSDDKEKYAKIVAEKVKRFGIGQAREGQPIDAFLKSIGQ